MIHSIAKMREDYAKRTTSVVKWRSHYEDETCKREIGTIIFMDIYEDTSTMIDTNRCIR